jgi:hypothetical protein
VTGLLHIYTTKLQYESMHVKTYCILLAQPCYAEDSLYHSYCLRVQLFSQLPSVILSTWNQEETFNVPAQKKLRTSEFVTHSLQNMLVTLTTPSRVLLEKLT